jgi:hypothetical protein
MTLPARLTVWRDEAAVSPMLELEAAVVRFALLDVDAAAAAEGTLGAAPVSVEERRARTGAATRAEKERAANILSEGGEG